jgi:hypothetical protein
MRPSAVLAPLAALVLAALTLAACDAAMMAEPGLRAPIPVIVPARPALPPAAGDPAPTELAAREPEPAEPPAPPGTGAPVVIIPEVPQPLTPAAPAPPAAAPPAAAPTAAAENPLLAQQRAACAREGGRLQSLASGLVTCIRTTRDGGRRCTQASVCEGLCLARSGTCAPITPLFGCHEVLVAPGARVTQCLD